MMATTKDSIIEPTLETAQTTQVDAAVCDTPTEKPKRERVVSATAQKVTSTNDNNSTESSEKEVEKIDFSNEDALLAAQSAGLELEDSQSEEEEALAFVYTIQILNWTNAA